MAYKMYPVLFNGEAVRAVLGSRKTQTRRPIKLLFEGLDFAGWHPDDASIALFVREDEIGKTHWSTRCPYGVVGDHLWMRETWRIGAWNDNTQIAVDYRADGYARREWLDVPDEDMFERLWIQSSDDALAAGIVEDPDGLYYWAPGEAPTRWRPSIHMPRWASRIALEVTDVRVKRVQEISKEDALAEGLATWMEAHGFVGDLDPHTHRLHTDFVATFGMMWDTIYAKPKPAYKDKKIMHYASYPWESGTETRDHRGLPWFVHGNPWVWATSFKRLEG